MFGWLKSPPPREWHLPPGIRVYAIGDIHGRVDLLEQLLDSIAKDISSSLQTQLVFLGDYIDRGMHSRQVINRLLAPLPAPAIFLRGNHEESILKYLDDEEVWRSWSVYGGLECVLSYGVKPNMELKGKELALDVQEQLLSNLPAPHRAFLTELQDSYTLGDYFFCHAGVAPNKPLASQSPHDLRWIREPFLSHNKPLEKMIVHGHTPSKAPEFCLHRCGIDTGAYASGCLTALVLEGATHRILNTLQAIPR
jgi:serine/threonine protein phosphatase 1